MSSLRVWTVLTAVLAAVPACTEPDPTYCDEDRPCPSGMYCDPTHTCRAIDGGLPDGPALDGSPPNDSAGELANGAPCAQASECATGYCVDDVCCEASCDQACRSCNLAGQAGTCVLVPQGSDPRDECGGKDPACGGTCDGKGSCLFAAQGTSCGASTCAGGLLTAPECDGQGDCVTDSSTCGGYACNSAGTACLTRARPPTTARPVSSA